MFELFHECVQRSVLRVIENIPIASIIDFSTPLFHQTGEKSVMKMHMVSGVFTEQPYWSIRSGWCFRRTALLTLNGVAIGVFAHDGPCRVLAVLSPNSGIEFGNPSDSFET